MFKLINSQDSKVFSSSKFIKNADFFKDEIAFFDAFDLLCEKNIDDIPNYCLYSNKKFCLEGICLLFKTYASELGFSTIDLSIDYLKILYYAIAALSKDGEFVSKDEIINEYLVYRETNRKFNNSIKTEYTKAQKKYDENLLKFENTNKKYKKTFISSQILDVLSLVSIVFMFICATIPINIHYLGVMQFRTAVIFAVASVLIGFVLKFEFKFIAKHLNEVAMEDSYNLQTLKKYKDDAFKKLSELKIKNSTILCDYYEYNNGFERLFNVDVLNFDEILKLSLKDEMKSYNLRADIFKRDKKYQDNVYNYVDQIMNIVPGDEGKLENIYNQICEKDYLKYNSYIRTSFINKFIECAEETNHWKLRLLNSKVDPFGIDVKEIASENIIYLRSEKEPLLSTKLNIFFETKFAKNLTNLKLHNIKNEVDLNLAKVEYINHFYNYETLKDKKELFEVVQSDVDLRQQLEEDIKIPKKIKIKLALIKNRVICNTLGEKDFLKIKDRLKEYETTLKVGDLSGFKEKDNLINEKTDENKEFIRTLLECDDIKNIGNDQVLCVVGNQTFRGFKLSNI